MPEAENPLPSRPELGPAGPQPRAPSRPPQRRGPGPPTLPGVRPPAASRPSTALRPRTCPGWAREPVGGGRRTAASPEEVWVPRSPLRSGPCLRGPSWEAIRVVTSLHSATNFSRRKTSPAQGSLGPAALQSLLSGYLRDWQLPLRNIFWMEHK